MGSRDAPGEREADADAVAPPGDERFEEAAADVGGDAGRVDDPDDAGTIGARGFDPD